MNSVDGVKIKGDFEIISGTSGDYFAVGDNKVDIIGGGTGNGISVNTNGYVRLQNDNNILYFTPNTGTDSQDSLNIAAPTWVILLGFASLECIYLLRKRKNWNFKNYYSN